MHEFADHVNVPETRLASLGLLRAISLGTGQAELLVIDLQGTRSVEKPREFPCDERSN